MKRNYCLSLVLLALFGVSAPFAANAAVESVLSSQSTQQAKKITGKVLDAAGEPIIGASVLVKGSGTGAVTDIDGNFSVEAPVGSTLEVSFIGYKTVTLKVTNATTYTVSLQDDSQALDEVVVTAMGIKKERKALGYSMEDVKSDELMKMKTANPISSLSGKVAGVNVTQSSGAAGAGAQIILRGGTSGAEGKDNQPLFVVDGVIFDNSSSVVGNSAFDGSMRSASTTSNRLMDINPEDIESMSVLKGPAAAALYGSRAANGVILACKKHPLFDYVLSTYKQDAQNDNRPIQRQYFYNREEAFESFATRSGLVDERKLFTETQLQLIHAGLVKLRTMDEELSEEDMKTVGELVNRVEEIVPELHREERKFDVSRLLDALSMGNGMER